VESAAKDSLLKQTLFDPTKDVVIAIRSRYELRLLYNSIREKPEFLVDGTKRLELLDWSKTRFIGALHCGYRFFENGGIIKEVARQSQLALQDKNRTRTSLSKFPHEITPKLDQMLLQWQQISLFSPFFGDAVRLFSSDKYPVLGHLFGAILMLQVHIMENIRTLPEDSPVRTFGLRLIDQLRVRFDMELKNDLVCAATACDIRFRNFDPRAAISGQNDPQFRFKQNLQHLYTKFGDGIMWNTIRCYYRLFPTDLIEERNDNPALAKAYELNSKRDGLDTEWLAKTRFYVQLTAFFGVERKGLRDNTDGKKDAFVSLDTDPFAWIASNGALFPMVRRLALVVLPLCGGSVENERIWKALDKVVKGRGRMAVDLGVDQLLVQRTRKFGTLMDVSVGLKKT
jgi:hypothetical protein